MRTDYSQQLNTIESEFERERIDLLKRNEDEIKQLFNEHKAVEEKFLKERQEKEEDYAKQLEDVRSQDANN